MMLRTRISSSTIPTAIFLLTIGGTLTPGVKSQLRRGHSLLAVLAANRPSVGEIWDVDHLSGRATQIAIPKSLSELNLPNAILMDPASADANGALTRGWVGSSAQGNIFEITFKNGTITARQINTIPSAGPNLSQLVRVGSDLYFTTQKGNGADGLLQSVSINTGPVLQHADFAKHGGRMPFNACAKLGDVIYSASFNSGTFFNGVSEVIAYDLRTKQASKLMDIPAGVFQNGQGFGTVSMNPIPTHPTRLALFGIHGDYFEIDVAQKQVVVKEYTGTSRTPGGDNRTNCAHWNPVSRDWIVGTRDGAIDIWVDGQSAENFVSGIGSGRFAVLNSVNGLYHHPFKNGHDEPLGGGCTGPGGFTATDASFGSPTRGNTLFQMALHSATGGDLYLLRIGLQPLSTPFDLGVLGAPGCKLYGTHLMGVLGGVAGTGTGAGTVRIPVPIPRNVPAGTKVYRQWLVRNQTRMNPLGVTVSNARMIEFR